MDRQVLGHSFTVSQFLGFRGWEHGEMCLHLCKWEEVYPSWGQAQLTSEGGLWYLAVDVLGLVGFKAIKLWALCSIPRAISECHLWCSGANYLAIAMMVYCVMFRWVAHFWYKIHTRTQRFPGKHYIWPRWSKMLTCLYMGHKTQWSFLLLSLWHEENWQHITIVEKHLTSMMAH